jgi:ATP-binding cassette subfamily B protein RaxB
LLDEATSHLDIWNEQLVNAAIKRIELTRILVAHRPETIAMAQRVVVLHGGQIVRDLEQPLRQTSTLETRAQSSTEFSTVANESSGSSRASI